MQGIQWYLGPSSLQVLLYYGLKIQLVDLVQAWYWHKK